MSERVMVAADSKVGSLYGFYLLALGAALVGNLLLTPLIELVALPFGLLGIALGSIG